MLNDAIWEHIDKFTKATKTSDIQQLLGACKSNCVTAHE